MPVSKASLWKYRQNEEHDDNLVHNLSPWITVGQGIFPDGKMVGADTFFSSQNTL